ncbi:protein of unknown function [Xenorhabdus poinarii G6]|uniref:Uncharacterized protein n=1 Tax=Xenorhabdus poinarii G6 TaxID=1354304 RepID=A0A068R0V7_9GAMM|nr:hypothetical protein [Xenorhabdus poinarii]CDG20556.1 protein of unknown function [Xenorhabdus poinarii G6]
MKVKIPTTDEFFLDDALEINEEIQAILVPLLTAVEDIDEDVRVMLRAVQRLSRYQYRSLCDLKIN